MYADSVRSNRWIWWLRLYQMLNALVAIGTAAESIAVFTGSGCGVPARNAFNIAAGAITVPLVTYLIVSTGYVSKGFWRVWIQLGIDGFLFVLWIAAVATTPPDCNDICNACAAVGATVDDDGTGFTFTTGRLTCSCFLPGDGEFLKRSINQGLNSGKLLGTRETSSGIQAALIVRQAFEAILVVDFLITIVLGFLCLYGIIGGGHSNNHHNTNAGHDDFQMAQSEYWKQHGTENTDVAGNHVAHN